MGQQFFHSKEREIWHTNNIILDNEWAYLSESFTHDCPCYITKEVCNDDAHILLLKFSENLKTQKQYSVKVKTKTTLPFWLIKNVYIC